METIKKKADMIKITIGEEGIKNIEPTELSKSTLKRYYTKLPKLPVDDIFVRRVNTADTVVMCKYDQEGIQNMINLLSNFENYKLGGYKTFPRNNGGNKK